MARVGTSRAANIAHVSENTIREWAAEGWFKTLKKNAQGYIEVEADEVSLVAAERKATKAEIALLRVPPHLRDGHDSTASQYARVRV